MLTSRLGQGKTDEGFRRRERRAAQPLHGAFLASQAARELQYRSRQRVREGQDEHMAGQRPGEVVGVVG